MSGNIEDRWIWRGTRPVTTSPTYTKLPPATPQVSQAVITQTESYFTLEVNEEISSQGSEASHIEPLTIKTLLNSSHTMTTTDTEVSTISPHKTTNFLSQWNWAGGTANFSDANTTTFDSKSNISYLPTIDPILSTDNSSNNHDDLLNFLFHNTDLNGFHVSTTHWSNPVNELTVVPSYAKNIGNHTFHNSTGDPIGGLEFVNEDHHLLSYIIVCVLVILLIISILANSTIFFTIICHSYMRRTYFILYLSLAASDLLASVFIVPITILCILTESYVSTFPLCPLAAATIVLTTCVSVGTICSICIIRWWQFYNFNQTLNQEKLIIRLVILILWTTGCGIYFSLEFQDLVKVDSVCTLSIITSVLQHTLPLTIVAISVGFIIIIVVNYLTINKVRKQTIYPLDHQSSRARCCNYLHRIFYCTVKVNYMKDYESSGNTLEGFHQNPRKVISNTQDLAYNFDTSHIMEFVNYEKTLVNPNDWNAASSIPSPTEKLPKPEGPSQTEKPAGNQNISQQEMGYYSFTSLPQENHQPSISSKPQMKNRVFMSPPSDALDLTSYESELESEHLYEVIEPRDVQEVIPQTNLTKFSKELQTLTLPIPNTVEKKNHDANPVIMRETIINNMTHVPPDDHTVNTLAWKVKKICESLPTLARPSPFKMLPNQKTLQPHDSSEISSRVIMNNSTPDKVTNIDDASSLNANTVFQDNAGSESLQSQKLKPFFSLTHTDGSTYTEYMADLSATSSTHSSPPQKASLKQCAERISALSSGRTISQASEDDSNPKSSITPSAIRKSHHQSSLQPQIHSPLNPKNAIVNPVHLKCIRISQHLIALFAFAYLPLLSLHILASIVTRPMILYSFIIYISLLLAIHPSLYGLHSPILKNAIRKLVKKHRCSVHLIPGNQANVSHIDSVLDDSVTQQIGECSRQPTRRSSYPPNAAQFSQYSDTRWCPRKHHSSTVHTAVKSSCNTSSFSN